MKSHLIATLSALCLAAPACTNLEITPKDSSPAAEMGKCPPPDLYQAPAKCRAAQGISGDILGGLCVDMDNADKMKLTDLGFKLNYTVSNCTIWDVTINKLQPTGINTNTGAVSCVLSLPAIPVDAKYSQITLAIVHQVTVPGSLQQATIALFDSTPKPLWAWPNSSTSINQRTIINISKDQIPPGAGAQFQSLIQLYAPQSTTNPTPSWMIDSIAVLGNQ